MVVWNVEGNINQVCNKIATCAKSTANEIIRGSRVLMPENEETWCWDQEVQRITVKKKK